MRDPPFILEVRKHKLVHVQKDGRALYNRQVHCRVQRANCMTPILREVAGEKYLSSRERTKRGSKTTAIGTKLIRMGHKMAGGHSVRRCSVCSTDWNNKPALTDLWGSPDTLGEPS